MGLTGLKPSSLCFVKSGDAFLIYKQNKKVLNEVLYVMGCTGLELSSLCFVKSGDAFEARDKNEVFKESIYMWWVLLDLNHRACAL